MCKLVVCANTDLHTSKLFSIRFKDGREGKFFVTTLVMEGTDTNGEFAMRFKEPSPLFVSEFARLYMTKPSFTIEFGCCESCLGIIEATQEICGAHEDFQEPAEWD